MGQGKIVYIVPYGDLYDPSLPCCCHETFTITGVKIKPLKKKIENGLEHSFVNHWLNFV